MCRRKEFVIIIVLFLFTPLIANVERIILPSKDEKVYATLESRLYALKVKLKPKVIKSPVYWQEKLDWKEEIKNWKTGLLTDEIIPPIIIYKENFYPQEENMERYRWLSNNALVLVINPLDTKVKADLFFEANSFKKGRKLKILLNGEEIRTAVIPKKDEFSPFIIQGFILEPGKNYLSFFFPEGTDELKPQAYQKDKEPKEVSIKIKDNLRLENISIEGKPEGVSPEYKFTIPKDNLEVLLYFKKEQDFFLMSRDLNIDLEEYPYFDLQLKKPEDLNLEVFLGIDYTGDGGIDGYLNPKDLKEINLFELAKDTWPDTDYFKYGFRLKKIILLCEAEELRKEKICSFQFKNINFYSKGSIRIPLWVKKRNELTIVQANNLDYKTVSDKNTLIISTYFDSTIGTELEKIKEEVKFILKDGKELTGEIESETDEEFKLRNVKELEGGNVIIKKDAINYYLPRPMERKKVLEDEYVDLEIPYEEKETKKNEVFSLIYRLDNPEIQGIELFLEMDKDKDGIIDGEMILGRKEIIKGFKFMGTSGNMDLYEAYLSEDFPQDYKSEGETKSRFMVYKDNIPLKLTWGKWFENMELAEVGVEPRRVLISLPQGKPLQDNYYIIYFPLSKPSLIYEGFQELEIPLEPKDRDKIDKIVLRLRRNKLKEVIGRFNFFIKELGFYRKFSYPVEETQTEVLGLLGQSEIPLVKIDERIFRLKDFKIPEEFEDLERDVLSKRIELAKGSHKYEKLENPIFDVEWAILEPVTRNQKPVTSQEPQITFKKINPTKYLVKVEGAKEPFWLVFSESFHKQWRLYNSPQSTLNSPQMFDEIVADYPKLKVKEARQLMKFSPEDIKYLFKKPLDAEHHLVNGYANGWYIEPKRLGLPEDFTLVIYFWPQGLSYLVLGISGLTFLGCIVYLIWPKKR